VPYRLELTPAARRGLGALPPDVRRRVDVRMQALGEYPRPPGVEKLQGYAWLYRLRVGAYRIIYEIDDGAQRVLIVLVGHRREVYRRF
jgi:mRNA interferase RelE/StbE